MKRHLSAAFLLPCVFVLFALTAPPRAASKPGNTGYQTFVLSNEGSNGLVSQLIAASYGNDNLYQTLVDIGGNTNPTVSGVLTPAFLTALKNCPPSAVLTTQLQNVSVGSQGIAVSTDCTVQVVNISGATYQGTSGSNTLVSYISGVGTADFTYSTSATPLTSFSANGNTYNVFAIAWASSPPATPAPPTLWLAVMGCLALAGYVLWSRRGKHA
jgi:hypothetical protein